MAKKFVHIVEDCIGCGACTSLMSKYWTMQGSKAKLIKTLGELYHLRVKNVSQHLI